LALIAKLIGANDAVNEWIRFYTSLDYSRKGAKFLDFIHYLNYTTKKKHLASSLSYAIHFGEKDNTIYFLLFSF